MSPCDDVQAAWEASPLAHLPKCTTPVLIEHHEGDLRCPIGQGEEIFQTLKLLGKEVEFLRYPGGFHTLEFHTPVAGRRLPAAADRVVRRPRRAAAEATVARKSEAHEDRCVEERRERRVSVPASDSAKDCRDRMNRPAELKPFYDGWADQQRRLLDTLSPLTMEQVQLRPAPSEWAIWQLASNMAGGRLYWMCTMLGEDDRGVSSMFRVDHTTVPGLSLDWAGWEDNEDHPRSAEELEDAFRKTWEVAPGTSSKLASTAGASTTWAFRSRGRTPLARRVRSRLAGSSSV